MRRHAREVSNRVRRPLDPLSVRLVDRFHCEHVRHGVIPIKLLGFLSVSSQASFGGAGGAGLRAFQRRLLLLDKLAQPQPCFLQLCLVVAAAAAACLPARVARLELVVEVRAVVLVVVRVSLRGCVVDGNVDIDCGGGT